jgi:hypothetical protein
MFVAARVWALHEATDLYDARMQFGISTHAQRWADGCRELAPLVRAAFIYKYKRQLQKTAVSAQRRRISSRLIAAFRDLSRRRKSFIHGTLQSKKLGNARGYWRLAIFQYRRNRRCNSPLCGL